MCQIGAEQESSCSLGSAATFLSCLPLGVFVIWAGGALGLLLFLLLLLSSPHRL